MALFEEQMTDTLETGAPSIKYEGEEGPQDPRQEQMLAQLKEEYMQYVFEMKELQEPIMSFEEWYQSVYEASKMGVQAPQEEMGMQQQMMREPAAYGGIMDTESGRRAYGLGSIFKKITNPIKKVVKGVASGAKKIFKSPVGKMGLAALLMGPAMGALGGGAPLGAGKFLAGGPRVAGLAGKSTGLKGLLSKAIPHLTNPKTLAKIGIGAASALPLLGIGTQKQEQVVPDMGKLGSFDFDYDKMIRRGQNLKSTQDIIDYNKEYGTDLVEDESVYRTENAYGGRIGYADGDVVEEASIMEKIRPGSVDIIEKIKEGIIEGGKHGRGIPGLDDAVWIEKIKDFIRKKRGEGRPDLRPGSMEEIEELYEGLRPEPREDLPEELKVWENPRRPLIPEELQVWENPRRPMRPMPDMPRRQPYALGSKADFAIEDVMTGGVEDEIGGITGIMRQADLQRKGNIGQFYAAEGGSPKEGGIMDLGGMEKDYRETGGFVDLGAEEKADDVPARLSVNEFVMTADAVRGAGDGDIDLGAERMEDVMKQLEQKGQQFAGGGERGWKAQMLAEELAQERYGMEFYDLSQDKQFEIYNIALDMIDSGGEANKGASEMFEVSERLSEVV